MKSLIFFTYLWVEIDSTGWLLKEKRSGKKRFKKVRQNVMSKKSVLDKTDISYQRIIGINPWRSVTFQKLDISKFLLILSLCASKIVLKLYFRLIWE